MRCSIIITLPFVLALARRIHSLPLFRLERAVGAPSPAPEAGEMAPRDSALGQEYWRREEGGGGDAGFDEEGDDESCEAEEWDAEEWEDDEEGEEWDEGFAGTSAAYDDSKVGDDVTCGEEDAAEPWTTDEPDPSSQSLEDVSSSSYDAPADAAPTPSSTDALPPPPDSFQPSDHSHDPAPSDFAPSHDSDASPQPAPPPPADAQPASKPITISAPPGALDNVLGRLPEELGHLLD